MPWLEKCIQSVTFTRDIHVVLDPESSDGTREFLLEHGITFLELPWSGFGPQHQKATESSPHDWVFKLDSDEMLSQELNAFLKDFNPQDQRSIYTFRRKNLVAGKWIRHCGWWPDHVRRLFNKNHSSFTDDVVHETIRGKKEQLVQRDEHLTHHAYDTIDDFIDKVKRYSTLGAQDLIKRNKSASPGMAILRGLLAFIKTYIFKRGFLDGFWGLIVSCSTGAVTCLKYMKAFEQKNAKT